MTTEDPPPITLPAISVVLLAELLTEVDEFLRSSPVATDGLTVFLAGRGHSVRMSRNGFPADPPAPEHPLLILPLAWCLARRQPLPGGQVSSRGRNEYEK